MNKLKISIIAVIGKNRELGKGNRLLWDLPEDMAYFRKTTLGHPVIMGSRTFESIGGKPLPNRLNIVVSSRKIKCDGCLLVSSVDEAFKSVGHTIKFQSVKLNHTGSVEPAEEVFIIGGASIYRQMISRVDRLYLTNVDMADDEADKAIVSQFRKSFR